MKWQRRHYSAEEKAKISLEAISCQKQSTLEKRNAPEQGQKRGCYGSTEWAFVVPRRSWREISLRRTVHPNSTDEKLTKFREHLSQSR